MLLQAWGTMSLACMYQPGLWLVPTPPFLLGSILLHILDTAGIIFFLFCILLTFPLQFFWLCAIPSVDKPLPLHWTFCSHLPSPPLFTEYSEPLLVINLSPSVDLPPWDKCLRMELLEQRPKHLYGSSWFIGILICRGVLSSETRCQGPKCYFEKTVCGLTGVQYGPDHLELHPLH